MELLEMEELLEVWEGQEEDTSEVEEEEEWQNWEVEEDKSEVEEEEEWQNQKVEEDEELSSDSSDPSSILTFLLKLELLLAFSKPAESLAFSFSSQPVSLTSDTAGARQSSAWRQITVAMVSAR